jgi:hypothetical protein
VSGVEVRLIGRSIGRCQIDAGSSVVIQDCTISNGILLDGDAELDLRWSVVHRGLSARGQHEGRGTSITVVGCVFGLASVAIEARRVARLSVRQSRFVRLRIGILGDQVDDLEVVGNEITQCGEAGIVVQGEGRDASRATITDNLIDLNGCGILTTFGRDVPADRIVIADNDIIGNYDVSGMVPQAMWGPDGANLRLHGATVDLRDNRYFECSEGQYRLPAEHYSDRRGAVFGGPVSLDLLPRDWARPRPSGHLYAAAG